jgi:hypothetical protein
MVLDALIGNTDRHHENWGLLLTFQNRPRGSQIGVAPSFDHASSLGRELRDERRIELLNNHRIEWYVRKGRGGIFRQATDRRGENPLKFVQLAARAYPEFFEPALKTVANLPIEDIRQIVRRVPQERASEAAKDFAVAMIISAQASLKDTLT